MLRPFFSFYGGKWRAAKLYPPPDSVVIEPFAGSAGYSVYYGVERAVLIDKDEAVCGVWDYLIHVKPAEVYRLPDLSPGCSVDDLRVCQEAKWLIGFWLNAASSTPKKTLSAWAAHAPGSQLVWGPRVRERIASQVDRIRRWTIKHGSYCDAPDIAATWFIDPPYQVAGKHYRHAYVDYERLSRFCRGQQGRVIVCENAGADWLPFRHLAAIKAGGGSKGGHSISHEVVWTRGC